MVEVESSRAYLLECCALEAAQDAHGILELRRTRRGVSRPEPEVIRRPRMSRSKLQAKLDRLVEDFFEVEPKSLNASLAKLNGEGHGDLEGYLARLRRVAAARPRIDEARQDRRIDKHFFEDFRSILLLPREERNQAKRRASTLFTQSRGHRRRALKAIRRMEKHYPELFEFERPWFAQWLNRRGSPASPSSGLRWLGWLFVASFAFRLIRLLFFRED